MISGLCQLPVNFFFTVGILLYYFGISFVASLIVFGISFLINKSLARKRKILQKERLKLGDSKSNDINEILTNAKMLKLYGWQEKFKTRIQESREKEKFVLRKLMHHDAISQALNHLLPNLIPAVCYSVFISLGHSLNLSTAVMTMAYFHKLSWT